MLAAHVIIARPGQSSAFRRDRAVARGADFIMKLPAAAREPSDGALTGADDRDIAFIGRGQRRTKAARGEQPCRVGLHTTPGPATRIEQIEPAGLCRQ